MNKFDSIRPYNDSEVSPVLSRLVENKHLQDLFISSSLLSKISFFPFTRLVAKKLLISKSKKIKSISDYQKIFEGLVENVISNSINSFDINGLDSLDEDRSYLFISNHRDITLDSALLNYSLHKNNLKTTNNAVGNNLMEEEWASDLMRLNKSFIIDRNGKSKREIYNSLNLASEFIQTRILNSNESIWIAQKQGRSKDGIDITDPSVLKMIHLYSRKKEDIGNCLNKLNLIPVGISYEYDPNDIVKAKELYSIINGVPYVKNKGEDLESIASGIQNYKGNVCLNVGKKISFDSYSYSECANLITDSINSLYINHPTNYVAKKLIENKNYTSDDKSDAIDYLKKRMSHIPDEMHDIFLSQYSNSL